MGIGVHRESRLRQVVALDKPGHTQAAHNQRDSEKLGENRMVT